MPSSVATSGKLASASNAMYRPVKEKIIASATLHAHYLHTNNALSAVSRRIFVVYNFNQNLFVHSKRRTKKQSKKQWYRKKKTIKLRRRLLVVSFIYFQFLCAARTITFHVSDFPKCTRCTVIILISFLSLNFDSKRQHQQHQQQQQHPYMCALVK